MAYNDFLKNIDRQFEEAFKNIDAEHNFELGNEFENKIYKVLRKLLPSKYGICRGFIVTLDGQKKGDDLIIFDKERFPLLRFLDDNFSEKQNVPIEAVYAYIELKHTMYLSGDSGQSYLKAFKQVTEAINLKRSPVSPEQISPTHFLPKSFVTVREGWPDIQNPLYGAIIAFQVKDKPGPRGKVISSSALTQELMNEANVPFQEYDNLPSLIICGKDIVCFPTYNSNQNFAEIKSPFYIKNKSYLTPRNCEGSAFSSGMIFLMWAIENILLGQIYWPGVVSKGLEIPILSGTKP